MRTIMSRMEEKDKVGIPREQFETAGDLATDSIPGVSETKDIISLSTNVGKGDYIGAGIDATALAIGAFPILGDVARQGFKRVAKSFRDKDIKDAKKLIDDDNSAEAWKKANKLREQQRQKRVPVIQEEAVKLSEGLTSSKKYRDVVKAEQPIKQITKDNFPELPTKTDIVGALKATDPRKIKTGIIGINKKIEDGTLVGSRLDIPSYDNYDKWIVSLHDGTKKGGDAIGYGQTALLKNVEFVSSAKGGLNIAKGKPKATIARIHGKYYNAEPELVYESAKKLMDNPEWIQVGMNPFKHSYFYNKTTGMPVFRADEVVQVGPLVLAKGIKKPTISELKQLKVKTKDGKIRMFNKGGTAMKQQMEMFEDGGLRDQGDTIDPVSGNDVPSGSTQEEVRDDIPAQLSEGEFVLPADVVRYHGLEKIMALRDEAKAGLAKMEAMGQMGNSEEATLPDDMPFSLEDLDMEDDEPVAEQEGDSVEMAEGGYVMIAGKPTPIPRIGGQLPPITTRPNESTKNMAVGGFTNPTGTYQVPTNIATQPSYFQNYAQSTAPFSPFNPVETPIGTPLPTSTPVVGQTGQGPSFNTLMPQLTGKRETKEYRNAAGQKLFIPFINDEPIYPIPEGYTLYTAETETTPEKQPTVQSTSVRQQEDGGDSNVLSGTSQVRGTDNSLIDTRFGSQSPEKVKDSFGKMTESQRGLAVLNAMDSAKGSSGFMKNLASGMISLAGGPLGMAAGAYDTVSKLGGGTGLGIGQPQTANLDNITNAFGYNIDNFSDASGYVDDITTETNQKLNTLSQAIYGKSYEEATEYLGVKPLFTKGYKNGQIDPTTGGTYSNGQSTNDDGSVSYGSFSDAGSGFTAMSKSGFAGGLKDAERVASKATASAKDRARAQTYIDVYTKEQASKTDKTSGLIADKKDKEEAKAIQDNADRVQALEAANERRAKEDALTFGDVTKGADIGTVNNTQSVESRGDPSGGWSDSGNDTGTDSGGSVSDSGYGGSGGPGDFNIGGLAGKKKPKSKKMKRGGLASRK